MTNPAYPTTKLNDLTVHSGYTSWLREQGLDSLDGLFNAKDGESLNKPGLDSWRQRLRLQLPFNNETTTFYMKRFFNPPSSTRRELQKSGCEANSTAGLEWSWLHYLSRSNIPCAVPIAMGQELISSRERRSAILMQTVPGKSLEKWASKWTTKNRPIIKSLFKPVAELVANFHDKGYIHRDLYLSHLFYDPKADLDRSLHLIDLQRVRKPAGGMRRWIVKDLAALNYSTPQELVSSSDRLRWLKFYLQTTKLSADARCLLYRVVGRTLQMKRHDDRKHGRHENAEST